MIIKEADSKHTAKSSSGLREVHARHRGTNSGTKEKTTLARSESLTIHVLTKPVCITQWLCGSNLF